MGKRITYTRLPKKPRSAKLAWSRLEKKYGAPQTLYLKAGDWVGTYGEERRKISDSEVRG